MNFTKIQQDLVKKIKNMPVNRITEPILNKMNDYIDDNGYIDDSIVSRLLTKEEVKYLGKISESNLEDSGDLYEMHLLYRKQNDTGWNIDSKRDIEEAMGSDGVWYNISTNSDKQVMLYAPPYSGIEKSDIQKYDDGTLYNFINNADVCYWDFDKETFIGDFGSKTDITIDEYNGEIKPKKSISESRLSKFRQ